MKRVFLIAALVLALPSTANAALTQVTGFGSNPGDLLMYKYVPAGLPANAPLVVVMHGCTQDAADMETYSGWIEMADKWKVGLVFPQQQVTNNHAWCFNSMTRATGDQERGTGEPLSIKQMVDSFQTTHSSDPARTYVTGLSGGGFMTSVMLATYPDVFESGAVVAGGPYRCADDQPMWHVCTLVGYDRTPAEWGDFVRNAYPGYTGSRPPVLIIHGGADIVSVYTNLREQMEQWTDVFGTDQTADAAYTVNGYPRKDYQVGGVTKVSTITIDDMNHGWPVDPGSGTTQCGAATSFFLDVNFCAAYHIGVFFGINSAPAPASMSFENLGAEDGYVSAGTGGASPALGTSADNGIGHEAYGRYDRTVLSFDTSAIPDGATITRAYIRVKMSIRNSNPWGDPYPANDLVLDVQNGCLSASCALETSDWAASATASSVASIPAFLTTEHSSDMTSPGRAAVNKTGRTQIKLRFAQNQYTIANIFIKQGADAKLMVEY